MEIEPGLLSNRIFKSGQMVPLDGIYGELWGSWLPLLKGERFPHHPEMGDSKWTYKGPLGNGLPRMKRVSANRQAKER